MDTHAHSRPNISVASNARTLHTRPKHWLCCRPPPPTSQKKKYCRSARAHTHTRNTFHSQILPIHTTSPFAGYVHKHTTNTRSWPNIISAGIFWKFQTVTQPAHTYSRRAPVTAQTHTLAQCLGTTLMVSTRRVLPNAITASPQHLSLSDSHFLSPAHAHAYARARAHTHSYKLSVQAKHLVQFKPNPGSGSSFTFFFFCCVPGGNNHR